MPFKLEPRREPNRTMLYASPVIAVALTALAGLLFFAALGYNGTLAIYDILILPVIDATHWIDLGVKAAPLVTIAIGLAIGFRANVWNIGAEGQYVMGAIAGTGVALHAGGTEGAWALPVMCLAGALGGALWAAIPALLRARLKVSEILTSLMLSYVAIQVLYFLVRGPWRDPEGFNFPQTRSFTDVESMPILIDGTRLHLGIPIAVLIAMAVWVVMSRTLVGFELRVSGLAPNAARYAGFREQRTVWLALLVSGGLAGLAGIFEAAGPFGQITPNFPTGYGFTAIVVAFLGRLNPLGILIGGVVLAVSFVGGELAETSVGLPSAAIGLFQATLLFLLLGVDMLVWYRIRRIAPAIAPSAAPAVVRSAS
ncbi:MAG: ABC transporter permease [Alphaproteobacteria bacterium]|nr:ABC transporter permease [Alphaproteobacteria bacterium]